MKQRVYIAGGSGLIGRALATHLEELGYNVYKIARIPHGARNTYCWEEVMHNGFTNESEYIIINLAGDTISTGRWTKRKKTKILNSRLGAIDNLRVAIRRSEKKPVLFLQGSAIGYYNSVNAVPSDEDAPKGNSFLADVVSQVESHAQEKIGSFSNVISIRTGIVWAKEGGAFPSMMLPFRNYVGGKIGNGKQWHSWIHITDEVRAIAHILKHGKHDTYNLVSPNPIQNKDFARILSAAMKRPNWFPVPGLLLRLLFGEKARALLLNGEYVFPKQLKEIGFSFSFEQAEAAIDNLLH